MEREETFYEKYIKRLLDIVCALAAIVVFCWLYILVAVLVRINLGSPIVFKQPRPGKDEKVFNIYKFRTMTDETDAVGNLLPDEQRLTKFGKFLRSTSLDELPEAFCILNGSMSVIGPRPLLISYLPYYTEQEKLRHTVRPGLSGLAQVSGRNALAWDDRLAKDIEYVEHISFLMDCKIVFMTIKRVIVRENIAEDTRSVEGNFAEIRKAMLEKSAEIAD